MGALHEEREKLTDKTLDLKRAIDSLREEAEAIDWYNQRMETCSDEELRAILKHNADEEKEHLAMLIAWIKKHDEVFSEELKEQLEGINLDH
jgi:hypothetical protein